MNRTAISILAGILAITGATALYLQNEETQRLKAESANAMSAMQNRLAETEARTDKERQEAQNKTAQLEATLKKVEDKISAPIPETKTLCTGAESIPAGQIKTKSFTVTQAMISPTIEGTFQVSGGYHNDIEAVIAEEHEYENWKNGNRVDGTKILYNSGRKTTGEINAQGMPPGNYVLGFSNKFAMMLPKTISCQVTFHYEIQP